MTLIFSGSPLLPPENVAPHNSWVNRTHGLHRHCERSEAIHGSAAAHSDGPDSIGQSRCTGIGFV